MAADTRPAAGRFRATVVDGSGRGGGFVARNSEQFAAAVGYRPYAGTLNLQCSRRVLAALRAVAPVDVPDDRTFYPLVVGGVACHAKIHGRRLEVVAPVRLRDHLGVGTGDRVVVDIGGEA